MKEGKGYEEEMIVGLCGPHGQPRGVGWKSSLRFKAEGKVLLIEVVANSGGCAVQSRVILLKCGKRVEKPQ